VDFSQEEIDLFEKILSTPPNLGIELSKYAKASLKDYSSMVLGQKVFTRGTDMLEFRLLNLIKFSFGGRIPSEKDVSALFQIKVTESRSLIRSIIAKYQYELATAVQGSLKEKMERDAKINAGTDYRINLDSFFLRDEYNKIIAQNPSLTLLTRDTSTNGTYILTNTAYDHLRAKLGIAVATINPYP